jgi:hypothetical protein
MATYTTYDQVGKAEDVSDIISNISPTKTPFSSGLKSEKISARTFDWQEDSLRAVQVNSQTEGFTASDATLTATTLRSNVAQILEKTIKVSATADAIKTYGRARETAYQLSKAGEELNRDLEHAMVGLAQASVTGNSTTARKMASALNQIDAAATVITDSNTGTTGNQAGPLTEANVLELHQKLYNEGADPSILMVKPADSRIVAGFSGVANARSRVINDASTTLVNSIEVYISPFGQLKVMLNRFLKSDHALMYDPDMWRKATLRPWSRTMLAKDGDSEKHLIVGEYSLKHANFKASGKITNLT